MFCGQTGSSLGHHYQQQCHHYHQQPLSNHRLIFHHGNINSNGQNIRSIINTNNNNNNIHQLVHRNVHDANNNIGASITNSTLINCNVHVANNSVNSSGDNPNNYNDQAQLNIHFDANGQQHQDTLFGQQLSDQGIQHQYDITCSNNQLAPQFLNNPSVELIDGSGQTIGSNNDLDLPSRIQIDQSASSNQQYEAFPHLHMVPSQTQSEATSLHNDTLLVQQQQHHSYLNVVCISSPVQYVTPDQQSDGLMSQQHAENDNLQLALGANTQIPYQEVRHHDQSSTVNNVDLVRIQCSDFQENLPDKEQIVGFGHQNLNLNYQQALMLPKFGLSNQNREEATNQIIFHTQRRSTSLPLSSDDYSDIDSNFNGNSNAINGILTDGKLDENCRNDIIGNNEAMIHGKSKTASNKNNNVGCKKTTATGSKSRQTSELQKRTFNCPTCNKGFTEKFNMKRHMQIHAQSRIKYVCNECNKSFAWKDNFIRHKKAVHELAIAGMVH